MQFSAGQIAEFLQGEVDGDAQVLVNDISKIEEGRPGTLSFLANPKYTEHVYVTAASVVLVDRAFRPAKAIPKHVTLIRVTDPRACFARLLQMHDAHRYEKKGYEQPSYISPKATLGRDVYIGTFTHIGDGTVIGDGVKVLPNCTIGDNVTIGDGTRIHANVSIYAGSVIGRGCIIHSGTVIGSDGFGFTVNGAGAHEKVPQIGNVVIEDDVEIGANCTIDRATLGSTVIRRGAKLDNLIQVGHNAEIGPHTVVVSQTGIAGSSRVGAHAMIGGQVGIAGHLTVGDRVKVAAQSGIGENIPDDATVQGSPAFAIGPYKRSYVVFRNLPALQQRVAELERALDGLRKAGGDGKASPVSGTAP
ncbi:MAG: UDP-3-O-(3-hydroxymyristoyl)glucosamine N-acyltransferase [Flavobacteriales bacterium]|nr:UDP-3-O-acylglucosamine N-acyltransferase [Flavobacteriales bacterium]MCC6575719.1 UDP-3-O-(3-hydroxymyristoyl)glucosamine N-acyltransferase [Flavobacteriales bacterium]NUQ16489.1 UDP-3-O-(3-hydroxymyristoyl)glucosamine N-acyltransferase [Flavobacteriales bacterium]